MTILLNWFGPCSESEIKWASRSQQRFHLIMGRNYDDGQLQLYYLGQCDATTLMKRAPDIYDRQYWWGEIEHAPPTLTNAADLTEAALCLLWEVDFTEGKPSVQPKEPLSIGIHWCKPDRLYRKTKPVGLSSLPTFFFWDGWRWHIGKI